MLPGRSLRDLTCKEDVRCGPTGIRWALSLMTGVIRRERREGFGFTDAQERCHVTTGPETAVMWLKTPRMLGATRSRGTDLTRPSHSASWRGRPCPHLDFGLVAPRTGRWYASLPGRGHLLEQPWESHGRHSLPVRTKQNLDAVAVAPPPTPHTWAGGEACLSSCC